MLDEGWVAEYDVGFTLFASENDRPMLPQTPTVLALEREQQIVERLRNVFVC